MFNVGNKQIINNIDIYNIFIDLLEIINKIH